MIALVVLRLIAYYETVGEYSRELQDLFFRKEQAYANKDYNEVEYIKGQRLRIKLIVFL